MKIVVYAICKNEAQFVRRWMDSMGEADGIFVLDTGSDDGTPELLADLGAVVKCAEVKPWRFDTARNISLAMTPEDTDICVCTDLDEVFHPGWRAALEKAWVPGTTQARYRYTWSFREDGSEDIVFWAEKMHARHGYTWRGAVHEVPACISGRRVMVTAEGVQLDHYPDPTKSRAQYLPLLEIAVAEDPENDRNVHYLGREYMFAGRWEDCITVLRRHLSLKSAVWRDERCASMLYIARSLKELGRDGEAWEWLLRAAGEAPWLREPWLELARHCYRRQFWEGVLFAAECALKIRERPQTYISRGECWGTLLPDMEAIACHYLGMKERAVALGEELCAREPDDERLRRNLEFYKLGL